MGRGYRVVIVVDADPENFLESFLVSTGVVVLGEMGDKTQLLAFLLATKFKRPLPIILGIFVATLLNHSLAGAVGTWIAVQLGAHTPALGQAPAFRPEKRGAFSTPEALRVPLSASSSSC